MKTLVLGCNGQLGATMAGTVPDNTDYVGLDLPDMDITNAGELLECCRALRPDVIFNAAAYTAVDNAESEVEIATSVNFLGARNVAIAAHDVGSRVIHFSTDFVFDGGSSIPYKPNVETRPLNVYGRTKRDGEIAVLEETAGDAVVIRTSWLYSKAGSNFVKTMLRLMGERDALEVLDDQIGTPTWSESLAEVAWKFAYSHALRGIYHWTDGGKTSWYDFAVAIQEEALSLGLLTDQTLIRPIRTQDYPAAATRPPYSVLDRSATLVALDLKPDQWRSNLHQMLKGMME